MSGKCNKRGSLARALASHPGALGLLAALLALSGCTSSKEIETAERSTTTTSAAGAAQAGEAVTWTVPPKIAPKVAAHPVQANLPPGHPYTPVAAPPGPKTIDVLDPREALLKEEIASLKGLFNKVEVDPEMHALLSREGVPQIEGAMVRIYLDRTTVSSETLAVMEGLETAHYISLYRTSVNDEGLRALAKCQKLFFLDLSYTHVTDAGLKHLHGLPNLTRVVVSDTRVTDAGMAKLQASLKNGLVSRNYDPR